MATNIAQYYSEEMVDWNDAITFYEEEIDDLQNKLLDVIRRNSIVDIAKKVGDHQILLNQVAERFRKLQYRIEQQESELKIDSSLVDNILINNTIETTQAELRREMYTIEKEYIDVKFDCYHFLSETLKK
ncbi:hypothetical protein [Daejeonella oryzae]|uniref:hypothetical protein n=1 Tax=Daejeonella oryzae TaxID=1122943 RepID=UPI00040DA227|nr:hypothetical protein [Daejeonella oryzae]